MSAPVSVQLAVGYMGLRHERTLSWYLQGTKSGVPAEIVSVSTPARLGFSKFAKSSNRDEEKKAESTSDFVDLTRFPKLCQLREEEQNLFMRGVLTGDAPSVAWVMAKANRFATMNDNILNLMQPNRDGLAVARVTKSCITLRGKTAADAEQLRTALTDGRLAQLLLTYLQFALDLDDKSHLLAGNCVLSNCIMPEVAVRSVPESVQTGIVKCTFKAMTDGCAIQLALAVKEVLEFFVSQHPAIGGDARFVLRSLLSDEPLDLVRTFDGFVSEKEAKRLRSDARGLSQHSAAQVWAHNLRVDCSAQLAAADCRVSINKHTRAAALESPHSSTDAYFALFTNDAFLMEAGLGIMQQALCNVCEAPTIVLQHSGHELLPAAAAGTSVAAA